MMKSIYTTTTNPHFLYVLGLGDDALILGHRWSEWLSKGPTLELDIAASNMALDLVGQADLWLKHAGNLEGAGRTSDDLAYLRDTHDFRCHWLVEHPNEDWGVSTARFLMFSVYQYIRYERLMKSSDEGIAEIAAKAFKEVSYHRRFSTEWAMRLGQGTGESNKRLQDGFNSLWRFVPELFETPDHERDLADKGIAVASADIEAEWTEIMDGILGDAEITKPAMGRLHGSRHDGHHTEHLGHILCEMQYLQRVYPTAQGATW